MKTSKNRISEDTEEVYILEFVFLKKETGIKVAKEIRKKTGWQGVLYKTKLPKKDIMISFK